ncbi:hypothetical protein [Frankia sp. QA3]|uniref:hypothetical protein n=1 Tax=Frankia sp. QA3 TaxID=710111 RepID=UPI000269C517|nr:hypothetical protein [Frankia sp. QA3]EIV94371.1 hypothetical protein FraQA3DRAFT_4123 [Frankia sp. QA3]
MAPPVPRDLLAGALRAALAAPAERVAVHPPSVAALRRAVDGVGDAMVVLLSVLGAATAAADPMLPLRLRHRVAGIPPLPRRYRSLLMAAGGQSAARARTRAGSVDTGPDLSGVSRRGRITRLLTTQFALPADHFALRHARGELMYRMHEVGAEPPSRRVMIILDVSPATFGPIEIVLRLVAHLVATAVRAADQEPHLVPADASGRRRLDRPEDLVDVWTSRSLDPPDLPAAVALASQLGQAGDDLILVLGERHAVRDQGLRPGPGLRILTVHAPADPPPRAAGGPGWIHLPPTPDGDELAAAVRALVAFAPVHPRPAG